ncbi:RNA polymerase sigma factor [Rubinisphaera margarita]|uniref:RNA polymerase sigma factor n=1 Tax=Rubinisphaera margarita TaxID=2909586 RepID=UPI001EE7BA8C|nr:sigma-70 family RNA polymerase sigma factor [Rubinisphaera margarita]MCG6156410.1 sigma-70 family RNA polymerase sigma factor [Rubinisphaera margarita]
MTKRAQGDFLPPEGDSVVTSLTLLNELGAGCDDAWTEFILKYRPWLMRNCRRAGLSEDDAENVIQEVLLTLHRRINQFNRARRGSFRRWLRLVLRSRVVDLFRSSNKFQEELKIAAARRQDRNCSGQQEEVDRHGRFSRTMELIKAEFSDRDLIILMQYLAYGQSARSIAEEFDVTPNTVYLIRSRILKRVREAILSLEEK